MDVPTQNAIEKLGFPIVMAFLLLVHTFWTARQADKRTAALEKALEQLTLKTVEGFKDLQLDSKQQTYTLALLLPEFHPLNPARPDGNDKGERFPRNPQSRTRKDDTNEAVH